MPRNIRACWNGLSKTSLGIIIAASSATAGAEGLIIFGSSEQGGGSDAYESVIDLASGHQRTTQIHGQSSDQNGFDGQLWVYFNGSPNVIDMPSAVADGQALRWINQRSWSVLGRSSEGSRHVVVPGASPIDLTFDPITRRVSTATFAGEYGPVSVKFGDWRAVGKYMFPFRQERDGDLDGTTLNIAQSVRPVDRVDPRLLARPVKQVMPSLAAPVTVPFKSVGQKKNHMLVMAAINGKPAEFIFDTGGANLLTTDAAKRLGIVSAGGVSVGGVGAGTSNGGYGQVNQVTIGPAMLKDQSFIIVPSFFPPENGKPSQTAGALGYEFLAHFITTMDYRAETMTFSNKVPAGQKGIRLPFVSDGHAIAIEGRVNGRPAWVRLDNGDGGTLTLFPNYIAASGIDVGSGAVIVGGAGAGGNSKAREGKIDRFTLAGVDFDRLPVHFGDMKSGAFASSYLAGNLGAGVLRCFRITFDYPHHQLWLEPQLDTPQCAAAPKPVA